MREGHGATYLASHFPPSHAYVEKMPMLGEKSRKGLHVCNNRNSFPFEPAGFMSFVLVRASTVKTKNFMEDDHLEGGLSYSFIIKIIILLNEIISH